MDCCSFILPRRSVWIIDTTCYRFPVGAHESSPTGLFTAASVCVWITRPWRTLTGTHSQGRRSLCGAEGGGPCGFLLTPEYWNPQGADHCPPQPCPVVDCSILSPIKPRVVSASFGRSTELDLCQWKRESIYILYSNPREALLPMQGCASYISSGSWFPHL